MNMDFSESAIPDYRKDQLTPEDLAYLNAYWLDRDALSSKWGSTLAASFVVKGQSVGIAPGNLVDVRMGGILFIDEEFEEFRSLALEAGASEVAVIEDIGQQDWNRLTHLGFFRFSFPLSLDWRQVSAACSLAEDVFLRPIRAFFVVTGNGAVGKYANNDADPPYEFFFVKQGGTPLPLPK